jgi:FAD/FMN-containing dehydrogenase
VSVNLENLQQFSMDESTYFATIGAGLLLGNVTELLYDAGGRSIPHGTCLQVGIGGHGTVGGAGPPSRLYGLTIDSIEEVEVVLANASIARASQSENPDLFFAVRGAGASFGIVTEYIFNTQPASSETVNYAYIWTATDAPSRAEVFKSWQAFISNSSLPREISCTLTINPSIMLISGAYFGSLDGFNALQFTSYFPPSQESSVTVFTNWFELSELWGEEITESGIASPAYFYAKSLGFTSQTSIPDYVADQMFRYLATATNGTEFWAINFEVGAGAINDVLSNATAFPHRDTLFWMLSYAKDDDVVSQTTTQFLDGLNEVITSAMPNAYYGNYAGYVDPKEPNEEARVNYWGSNLRRLMQIKAVVDPHDVFHNQQSVLPAS